MLECVAPPHFHLDRFLPPTPIRVMVDHRGKDALEAIPYLALSRLLKPGEGQSWMDRPEIREALLPRLIQKTQSQANRKLSGLVAKARQEMTLRLDKEIARLRELQQVNRSVRDEEIELVEQQQRALDEHLGGARLRLEALRLIHRGSGEGGLG
jgi:ATP-dependent helicase HepA